jgi:hypothetical protein
MDSSRKLNFKTLKLEIRLYNLIIATMLQLTRESRASRTWGRLPWWPYAQSPCKQPAGNAFSGWWKRKKENTWPARRGAGAPPPVSGRRVRYTCSTPARSESRCLQANTFTAAQGLSPLSLFCSLDQNRPKHTAMHQLRSVHNFTCPSEAATSAHVPAAAAAVDPAAHARARPSRWGQWLVVDWHGSQRKLPTRISDLKAVNTWDFSKFYCCYYYYFKPNGRKKIWAVEFRGVSCIFLKGVFITLLLRKQTSLVLQEFHRHLHCHSSRPRKHSKRTSRKIPDTNSYVYCDGMEAGYAVWARDSEWGREARVRTQEWTEPYWMRASRLIARTPTDLMIGTQSRAVCRP